MAYRCLVDYTNIPMDLVNIILEYLPPSKIDFRLKNQQVNEFNNILGAINTMYYPLDNYGENVNRNDLLMSLLANKMNLHNFGRNLLLKKIR